MMYAVILLKDSHIGEFLLIMLGMIVILTFIIVGISTGKEKIDNVLYNKKGKEALLKFLSSKAEIQKGSFYENGKIMRMSVSVKTKTEILDLAETVLLKEGKVIKDIEVVYCDNIKMGNRNHILISFKNKIPLTSLANSTGKLVRGFKEYKVSSKYGGKKYNEDGHLIFYTSVGYYYSYRM